MNLPHWPPGAGEPAHLQEQVLRTRTILMFGEVTAELAQSVTQQLLLLTARAPEQSIKLVVNAHGGAVEHGQAVYDVVQGVAPRVNAIAAGGVAGAAVLAFLAPPRAHRFSLPHARFTLDRHLGLDRGPGADLLAQAEHATRQRQRLHTILARQTGQPVETIERDLERGLWLEAEEAQHYGLVGKIIQSVNEV